MIPSGSPKQNEATESDAPKPTSLEEMSSPAAVIRTERQTLSRGDYVVQVHVIEARDLKGRGMGGMCDPVVSVNVMEQHQTSSIQTKCFNATWDQVMFFQFKDLNPEEINQGKCLICVRDANTIFRDKLIGSYEFDLLSVYYKPGHEIHRTWVALSDTTDSFEGVQGFLRVSVVVLGPNDEQVSHDVYEEDDGEGEMNLLRVLMPPNIPQDPHLLKVRVYECKDFPSLDLTMFGASCDPFFCVDFGGIEMKSEVYKGTSAVMNCEVSVPVMEPIMAKNIHITFFDHDSTGHKDRIATALFDYTVIKSKEPRPRWVNLYGAPVGAQRGLGSKMNRGTCEGTTFRGRVLMELEVEKVNNDPKKACVDISPCSVERQPNLLSYTLTCDVYEGSEIVEFQFGGDMHVEIAVGAMSVQSMPVHVKNGVCSWHETLASTPDEETIGPMFLSEDLEECPDVFVYLCNKEVRVSYFRIPFRNIIEGQWKRAPEWIDLKEDKAVDALKDDVFPGSILICLNGGLTESVPPLPYPETRPFQRAFPTLVSQDSLMTQEDSVGNSETTSIDIPTIENNVPIRTVGDLTVIVMRAENLPPMDRSGTSDPYVKLEVVDVHGSEVRAKTKTIKKCLDPVWNESHVFESISIDQALQVTLKDSDFLPPDDDLGEVTVELSSQSDKHPGENFDVTHWFFVNDQYPNAKIQLRICFEYSGEAPPTPQNNGSFANLFQSKKKKKKSKKSFGKPKKTSMQLRAHIFMGREIKALDANGFSDPYCVVRAAGLTGKTQICSKTTNPEWYETVVLNVLLPTPLDLAPHIHITVHDHDRLSHDDISGRVAICPNDIIADPNCTISPMWYDLLDVNGHPSQGKLLVSLQIIPNADSVPPILPLKPQCQIKWLHVVTLGLRDLQPTGGAHKPMIQFEVSGKKYETYGSCKPNRINPNFLQSLKIPIHIPNDPILAPTIELWVRDLHLGGLIKRHIGGASLCLESFLDGKSVDVVNEDTLQMELQEEMRRKREAEVKRIKEAKMKRVMMEDDEVRRRNREPSIRAIKRDKTMPRSHGSSPSRVPMSYDSIFDTEPSRSVKVDIVDEEEIHVEMEDEKRDEQAVEMANDEQTMDGMSFALLESEMVQDDDDDDETRPFLEDQEESFDLDAPDKIDLVDDLPPYMLGRDVYDNELEDVFTMSPFTCIPVHTGSDDASGIFSAKRRVVGYFKGLVQLTDGKDDKLKVNVKQVLAPRNLFVRLYVLKGVNLTPRDWDGTSDPYLVIRLGDQTISTRDRRHKNTLQPDFFESFEIACTIPGDARLEISVFDWDGLGDDLIGSTAIDIENRWFCKAWRKLKTKPVEIRTLRSPSSLFSQGKLHMWVEILNHVETKRIPILNIKPPPPEAFELRVIVWQCKDVTINDTITNQNDLFITGQLEIPGLKKQQTDLHFRSKNGFGSFNWRMKFPIELPQKRAPRFRLQIWDRDFFSPSDAICEAYLSLAGLFKLASRRKDVVTMKVGGKKKFWINDLRHPTLSGTQGRVQVSVECMPMEIAEQLQAGFGRADPNMNPFLGDPDGRAQLSLLNPIASLRVLLGDRLCFKICIVLFMSMFGSFFVLIIPTLVSTLAARAMGR